MATSDTTRSQAVPRVPFEDIHEAHRVMEAGDADGKMVVLLD